MSKLKEVLERTKKQKPYHPNSAKAWRRNAKLGSVGIFQNLLRQIQESPEFSQRSKEIAWTLTPIVTELYNSLKTRKEDNDSSGNSTRETLS